jgi:hypothetical protein
MSYQNGFYLTVKDSKTEILSQQSISNELISAPPLYDFRPYVISDQYDFRPANHVRPANHDLRTTSKLGFVTNKL